MATKSKLTPKRFGDLRAWLAREDLADPQNYRKLLAFLERARQADPVVFDEQWHPYIRRATPALPPFAETFSFDEAEALYALLPCHTMEVRLYEEMTLRGEALGALLAASPALERVRSLTLHNQGLGDDGLRALAAAAIFPPLEILAIEEEREATWAGYEAVLSRPPLQTSLKKLVVWGGRWGAEGAAAFARLAPLRKLKLLQLADLGLDATAAEALATCDALRRADHLHIGFNPLGDAGVAALAPATGHLKEVCFGDAGMSVEGLRALIAAEGLARASWLMLWRNPLGDAVAEALASADLPRAREVNLDDCQLTTAGVLALLDAPWFATIKALSVSMNPIDDTLIHALLARGELPGKATLAMRDCPPMTDAARDALSRSPLAGRVLVRW